MSQGLYTVKQIASYLGCRPQAVARMIKDDALPVVKLPCEKRPVAKITLHGLHGWLSARHSGTAFMSVEQLAAEIAAANVEGAAGVLDLLTLRSAVEIVYQRVQAQMEGGKAA